MFATGVTTIYDPLELQSLNTPIRKGPSTEQCDASQGSWPLGTQGRDSDVRIIADGVSTNPGNLSKGWETAA